MPSNANKSNATVIEFGSAVKAAVAPTSMPEHASQPIKSKVKFTVNERVICPSHGLGQVIKVEEQEVAGTKLTCYNIYFERDKMTMRIPTNQVIKVGVRKLASKEDIAKVMEVFHEPSKISRVMWSKRSHEYESKLYSGNIVAIAEVVRDLYRNVNDWTRSYNERVLCDTAFSRVISEMSSVTGRSYAEVEKEVDATLRETLEMNDVQVEDIDHDDEFGFDEDSDGDDEDDEDDFSTSDSDDEEEEKSNKKSSRRASA